MKFLDYLESAAISALAVFAPIKSMMLSALFLIGVDLITGIWAAHKRAEPITSKGISRTLAKVALYELGLATALIVDQYMTDGILHAERLVAGLIALVEAKSIYENLDTINGSPVFAALIDRTISAEKKLRKHRKRRKP